MSDITPFHYIRKLIFRVAFAFVLVLVVVAQAAAAAAIVVASTQKLTIGVEVLPHFSFTNQPNKRKWINV